MRKLTYWTYSNIELDDLIKPISELLNTTELIRDYENEKTAEYEVLKTGRKEHAENQKNDVRLAKNEVTFCLEGNRGGADSEVGREIREETVSRNV